MDEDEARFTTQPYLVKTTAASGNYGSIGRGRLRGINGPWVIPQTIPLLPCERTSSVCRTTSERCHKQPRAASHRLASWYILLKMRIPLLCSISR
jgi:hypothetical protein